MLVIKSDGSKWLVDDNQRERPYRWYHATMDWAKGRWYSRGWRKRQKEFTKTGTRYYGDGGTIHHSMHLDVETDGDGNVVAVWFRCQPLPFRQSQADPNRAEEMTRMYEGFHTELHGVEVKDMVDDDR